MDKRSVIFISIITTLVVNVLYMCGYSYIQHKSLEPRANDTTIVEVVQAEEPIAKEMDYADLIIGEWEPTEADMEYYFKFTKFGIAQIKRKHGNSFYPTYDHHYSVVDKKLCLRGIYATGNLPIVIYEKDGDMYLDIYNVKDIFGTYKKKQ